MDEHDKNFLQSTLQNFAVILARGHEGEGGAPQSRKILRRSTEMQRSLAPWREASLHFGTPQVLQLHKCMRNRSITITSSSFDRRELPTTRSLHAWTGAEQFNERPNYSFASRCIQTARSARSAGVTPLIRDASPRVSGRMLASLCLASGRMP